MSGNYQKISNNTSSGVCLKNTKKNECFRSMATSISMIFGRLGATVGSQLFGYFQETYCDSIFYFLTAIQIGKCIPYSNEQFFELSLNSPFFQEFVSSV
jgi:hypothetical protein